MNAQVLAKQRAHIKRRTMPDLCTIYAKPQRGLADKGQAPAATYPTDWTVFASAVPCRVTTARQGIRESENAGRVQATGRFDIHVPSDTEKPASSCRIRVTTQSDRDFEIIGIREATDLLTLPIECVEVK